MLSVWITEITVKPLFKNIVYKHIPYVWIGLGTSTVPMPYLCSLFEIDEGRVEINGINARTISHTAR